jgi:hypothetical protein
MKDLKKGEIFTIIEPLGTKFGPGLCTSAKEVTIFALTSCS